MASKGQRLRLLAFHGFRTSGSIFAQQMEISGLQRQLQDLVDIVYIDAPNAASGPPSADVPSSIFPGPYYEWWNAQQDPVTQRIIGYDGYDVSLGFVRDYIALHGPFDGFWAFSQGSILASLLLGMKQQGLILQSHPPFKCTICIAGVRPAASVADQIFASKLQTPSLHIIGDKDFVRQLSDKLMDTFENPVLIRHPRGHLVPALKGDSLEKLRSFLIACQQDSAL